MPFNTIYNEDMLVAGFAGRDLNKSKVKYLNSPDTELFKKSTLFFNMQNALNSIKNKNEMIINEGYFEPIALHKVGIDNAVSLMGTDLSKDKIKRIKELGTRVNLMLDNDDPGKTAMLKHVEQLRSNHIDVVVTDLSKISNKKDVDEIINSLSTEELEQFPKQLESIKMTGLEFMIQEYCKEHISFPATQLQMNDLYSTFFPKLNNAIERMTLVHTLSQLSEFSIDQITQMFQEDDKQSIETYRDKIMRDDVDKAIETLNMQTENTTLKLFIAENKQRLIDHSFLYLKSHFSDYYKNDILDYDKLTQDLIINSQEFKNYTDLNNRTYTRLLNKTICKDIGLSSFTPDNAIKTINKMKEKEHIIEKLDECILINDVNDLFELLPTGLISPITFRNIQNSLLNDKAIDLDLNTMFDSYYLNNGILDCLSDDMKNDFGRLKTVLIIPNLNKEITVTPVEKEVIQDKEDVTVEKDTLSPEIDMEDLDVEMQKSDIIIISKNLVKETTEEMITVKLPHSSYYTKIPSSLFVMEKEKSFTVEIDQDIDFTVYNELDNEIGTLNYDSISTYFKILKDRPLNPTNESIPVKKTMKKAIDSITIDIKMFNPEFENEKQYFVRLPYHKDKFVFIDKDKSRWLKEDKTLAYKITDIEEFEIHNIEGDYMRTISKDDLLNSFELKKYQYEKKRQEKDLETISI